jgi:type II secretory pathway component PulF
MPTLKKVTKKKTIKAAPALKPVGVGRKIPWYKREVSLGSALKVSVVEVVLMAKHLAVMLQAGLTVPETLEVLVEQSSGKLRATLARVYRRVDGGSTLGDAIALEPKVFSPIFVSSVIIGENSGSLAPNLNRLAIQMEKELNLRRTIQSAMLYPMIVMVAALGLGFAVATFVLPQIAGVFESLNVPLPLTTRMLIAVSKIFELYGFIITPMIFGGLIFLVWFLQLKVLRPLTHRILLRIPFVNGFVHEINRARFCRTMGTLLESGTPIQESLEIATKAMPNVVYQRSLRKMVTQIGSGENLADILAFYPRLYPKVIQRMVSVGEHSGSLGSTLLYLAEFYEERVEVGSKNMASIIEPVLLICIGLVVGVVAVSILSPIYSITSSIRA